MSVEFSSTASNFLLGLLVALYAPLILAPVILIQFDAVTAGVMVVLLLSLAFGIYVFRGNPTRKKGAVVVSPGDARLETLGAPPFVLRAKGLSRMDSKTLRFSPAALFETRIYFENEGDCAKAESMILSYY